jgi:pimeloyl-ACP methyl ester carboxylesterase
MAVPRSADDILAQATSTVTRTLGLRTIADVKIHSDGLDLNLTIDGDEGAPPALLLHGIISSSRTWDWLVPKIADEHRVIRLDFRGHGGSDRAPERYQMADYVTDAIAVCEQVAGAPALVIGHSLGGATAAALAQRRPDLVCAALLEDAPLADPADRQALRTDDGEENALAAAFRLMRQTIPAIQASGVSADDFAQTLSIAPSAAGATFGELLLPDGVETMAYGMLHVDATVLDRVVEGTMVPAFDPGAPITVPVTAVAADPASPDAVTQPSDLDRLRSTSPTVETVTIAGAGHLIHDAKDTREPFWQVVERFLATHR